MDSPPRQSRSSIIPCLRYRDAPAAIEWLCKTFGFERHAVHANPDGSIAHAQLTLGDGMVMLGSVTPDSAGSDWGRLTKQPQDVGGAETQSPYVVVTDPDAIHAAAKAAGATIVIEIADADYGGRGFSCRDLEGHLWSFGSYDPWH